MRRFFLRHVLVPLALPLYAIAFPVALQAQPQLVPLPHDSTSFVSNPDSIKVDTAAPFNGYAYYARKWYWLVFADHVFSFSPQQADTATVITWTDIAPAFAAVRQGFDSLQRHFGPYRITRVTDDSLLSGVPGSTGYYLAFDTDVGILSVIEHLNTIPGVQGTYIRRGGPLATLPSDRALVPMTEWKDIVADPSALTDFWPAHFHRLGWHWNHYRQKSPMAWEITMGIPDVVIAFNDVFYGPISDHPDMDNFIRIDPANDGVAVTSPLRADPGTSGHGLGVSSCAIAAANNDFPESEGRGMVGSCPGCLGVNVITAQVPFVDVDRAANGVHVRPHILTSSAGFDPVDIYNAQWKRAVDNGIVALAAAGNHRDDWKNSFLWSRHRNYTNANGEKVALFYNWLLYPSALCWPDETDPANGARDVRVLAVGAVIDGTLHECDQSYEGRGLPEVYLHGPEQFHPAFNFGPGTEKFSVNPDPQTRIAAKQFAYIDIVAPTGRIVATDGRSETPEHRELFHPYHEGTSEATPSVAGVIGLMLGINPGMGAVGADVQRRVYDVVTFTADKIPDWQNFSTEEREASWISYEMMIDPATGDPVLDPAGNPVYKKRTRADWMPDRMRFAAVNPTLTGPLADGAPIQYHYVEQTNDPLHRWWAQRVGFGRLNAYRAVAHAIPLKGNPVWNVSQTLFNGVPNPPVNENGVRLMHFGAYNNAGQPVLQSGGEDIPGEDFNNQGSTWINGTGTELIVPENSILAVDGLLQSDNPTGNNRIRTGGTGKLLATGYVQDVRLVGNVRLDDLLVCGTQPGSTAGIEIGSPEITAEVYGTVRLCEHAAFAVNAGTLLMQPGSTISMEGEKDLYITGGASLRLSHAATVSGGPERRLVVESGSTLTIGAGAHVDLLTHLVIRPGGSVIIEPDAVVSLNRFTVERNGELVVREGARLRLLERVENLVNGRLHLLGTATKRVVVSGRVADCCTRICTDVIDRAYIRVQDDFSDPADRVSCNLRLAYTDFSSVPVRAVNVPLYPVRFCNFTAERALFDNPSRRVLLDLRLSDPDLVNAPFNPPPDLPIRESARLVGCSFSDQEGAVPLPRGTFTHTFTGLRLERMKRAWISSCNFQYLHAGIETLECDSVGVDVSEFFVGDFGVSDAGSVLRLCANTFKEIECGALLNGSASSWIFANTFNQSRVGLLALAGYASHFVRGNTFQDYQFSGILLDKTGARLDVYSLGRTVPAYSLWGRNIFRSNGTGTVFGPVAVNADIRMRDPFAAAALSCGFNEFAERSTWHLFADVPKTGYPVSFNRFHNPGGHAVRAFNVAWYGTPLNTAAALPGCTPVTGEYCAPQPPPPIPGIDPFYIADGSWPDLPWSDPYLAEAFHHARSEMMNPAVPLPSRLLKMRNALEAAVAGDSGRSRLETLRADYAVLATAPFNPDPLRSAARFLLGQVAERLGDLPAAAAAYTLVTNNYAVQNDSLPAAWRARPLAAATQDTTLGPVYDSLMNNGRDRLLADVRRLLLFPPSGQSAAGAQESGIVPDDTAESAAVPSLVNTPNPFRTETLIRFTLARKGPARLVITDEQGREIALLIEEILEPGPHAVTFKPGHLPAGVYFCRLNLDDEQYVRGITLQR